MEFSSEKMRVLTEQDAELANLILISVRNTGVHNRNNGRSSLVHDVIRCTDRKYTAPKVLSMMSKLIRWGVLSIEQPDDYDYFSASDLTHNKRHSPRIYTIYGDLAIFSLISSVEIGKKTVNHYELLTLSSSRYSNPTRWAEKLINVWGNPNYEQVGRTIARYAVETIASRFKAQTAPVFFQISDLVSLLQIKLFHRYPLLNPLIIHAFIESATVTDHFELSNVESTNGMLSTTFEVTKIIKSIDHDLLPL
jgi:hypothetical protein